jgi:hypothetical protein
VEQAMALPYFLGAHWFQWQDQPVLGRMDGENYNIGLVDVTNRPYLELVQALKDTHEVSVCCLACSGRADPFDFDAPQIARSTWPGSPGSRNGCGLRWRWT